LFRVNHKEKKKKKGKERGDGLLFCTQPRKGRGGAGARKKRGKRGAKVNGKWSTWCRGKGGRGGAFQPLFPGRKPNRKSKVEGKEGDQPEEVRRKEKKRGRKYNWTVYVQYPTGTSGKGKPNSRGKRSRPDIPGAQLNHPSEVLKKGE